jgi:hypothetical protein
VFIANPLLLPVVDERGGGSVAVCAHQCASVVATAAGTVRTLDRGQHAGFVATVWAVHHVWQA